MLLRLCQLKSPLILCALVVISSCSWRKHEPDDSRELLTTFPNKWFSVSKNHSLLNSNLEPSPHLLFDTTPEFETKDQEVNVVIATPEESDHGYAVDLNSGQRFYTHSYCPQKDVWNEYGGALHKPKFSIGYIPRVLDQIGEPQKVVVWSKRKAIRETASSNFHKVRIVGAYVEQICPEGNCLGKSNWLSRLVFLGVDTEDPYYKTVKTTEDFQKFVKWREAKAILANIEGRNFIGDITYPTVRVGELIQYEDAFDYFKKRSIFLTDAELKKIQKGCHALYDRLWDEVGKQKPEDKPATTMDELNAKIKLHEKLKKENVPVGFAARFRVFTKKYFNEITTCEKFVYHGNVNGDQEKFWFLSMVGIYYRLHREGYFFDCKNKTWQRNVLNEQGQPIFDIKRDIEFCKEKEIDQAMDYMPNFLTGLKGEKEYYKFIDYDNQTYGTHQKMYSWVKIKNRRFDCKNDPNLIIKKNTRVFPEDITWKERNIKDIADKMKIIY